MSRTLILSLQSFSSSDSKAIRLPRGVASCMSGCSTSFMSGFDVCRSHFSPTQLCGTTVTSLKPSRKVELSALSGRLLAETHRATISERNTNSASVPQTFSIRCRPATFPTCSPSSPRLASTSRNVETSMPKWRRRLQNGAKSRSLPFAKYDAGFSFPSACCRTCSTLRAHTRRQSGSADSQVRSRSCCRLRYVSRQRNQIRPETTIEVGKMRLRTLAQSLILERVLTLSNP